MSSICPERPGEPDCGLQIVQNLLDYNVQGGTGFIAEGKMNVIADETTLKAINQTLAPRRFYNEGLWDTVELGCLACGRCILATSEIDGQFARLKED